MLRRRPLSRTTQSKGDQMKKQRLYVADIWQNDEVQIGGEILLVTQVTGSRIRVVNRLGSEKMINPKSIVVREI